MLCVSLPLVLPKTSLVKRVVVLPYCKLPQSWLASQSEDAHPDVVDCPQFEFDGRHRKHGPVCLENNMNVSVQTLQASSFWDPFQIPVMQLYGLFSESPAKNRRSHQLRIDVFIEDGRGPECRAESA